jgi:hypothetical protein
LQQTADYWNQIARMTSVGMDDRKSAQQKANEATLQLIEQTARNEHAVAEKALAAQIEANHAALKSKEETSKAEYELGHISVEQEIAQIKEATAQTFAANAVLLDQKKVLAGQDVKAQQEAQDAIVKNKQASIDAQLKLDQQLAVAEKKQWDELVKISEEMQKQENTSKLALYEQYLKTQVALGKMTNAEMEALQAQFYDITYQQEIANLTDRMNVANLEVTKRAEIMKQIEALELQHQLRMKQYQDKAAIDMENDWKKTVAPIQNAMDQSVTNMLMRTSTLRNGMRTIFTSIERDALQSITKMVSDWMMGEVRKLGISEAINSILIALGLKKAAVDTTTTQTSTVAAITASKVQAAAQIPAETGIAAMGAASAVAPVPIVGPALAAAASAAMMGLGAGALAFASAAGGYDVGNYNPITQLHAKEMVLPAKHADVIRSMADSNLPGAQGGGSTTHEFKGLNPDHLYQGSAFIGSIKKLVRDGHLSGARFS